jgi:predicted TIM-barrel fold metal-dependent hydrolase
MEGKWALEEHLSTGENNALWDSAGESARNGRMLTNYVEEHLLDVEMRLAIMDATGIERAILSLTSPGIQSITDTATAIRVARDTNDIVRSGFVDKHPDRFSMFACLPTQEPEEAAAELERAVRDLGAVGALINGYTNVGDDRTGRYLDHPAFAPLWAKIAELEVPVYLHPREPLPQQATIYEGYSSLVGSAWGFAHETSTHAVRLMLSGLFDQYPNIQIILGHLGEGLPFLLPRLEHRLDKQREGVGLGTAKRKVSHYFNDNFYITTSGHFHTRTLFNTISEIGVDRVMFSADFPYETMEEAASWFDSSLLSHNDSVKIGRDNARRLFRL